MSNAIRTDGWVVTPRTAAASLHFEARSAQIELLKRSGFKNLSDQLLMNMDDGQIRRAVRDYQHACAVSGCDPLTIEHVFITGTSIVFSLSEALRDCEAVLKELLQTVNPLRSQDEKAMRRVAALARHAIESANAMTDSETLS